MLRKIWVDVEKIWFVIIDAEEAGPYSVEDLKHLPKFTPDTLVRKAGSNAWSQARFVSELKKVFEDGEEETLTEEPVIRKLPATNEIVVDWREPPQFLWLIVVVILLVYTLYRFLEIN